MKLKVYRDKKDIKLPTKAHIQDAGFDIYAPRDFVLRALHSEIIDTGIHIDIPEGYVGFLKSKSGLNVKKGIVGEGVIDAGYTGSICVKLYNNQNLDHEFKKDDKIIQLVILPIPNVELEETESIDNFTTRTGREDGGFGSTGR